jgi:protein gp37
MNVTKIEWADYTINPIRFVPDGASHSVTMCQKVSPGCHNCYAEGITRRFWPKDADGKFPGYTNLGTTSGKFVLDEKKLKQALRHTKPHRIFWGDMTDIFQESVPDEFIDVCMAVCALNTAATHMFLTKRSARMRDYVMRVKRAADNDEWLLQKALDKITDNCGVIEGHAWPLPNVWLGVSCENQEYADKRVPDLLRTPAAIRFISAEPLLGPIELRNIPRTPQFYNSPCGWMPWLAIRLHWVITGGESGVGARPMLSNWADGLRLRCQEYGITYFHKQNGEWIDTGHEEFGRLPTGEIAYINSAGMRLPLGTVEVSDEYADVNPVKRVGKNRAGAKLFGHEYRRFPRGV